MRGWLLGVVGAWALVGCGGGGQLTTENVSTDSPPTSVAELMCSGQLQAECGFGTPECLSRSKTLFRTCVLSFVEIAELENPNDEQRFRLGGLSMLCAREIMREQQSDAGRPCSGEPLDPGLRRMCVFCAMEAGAITEQEAATWAAEGAAAEAEASESR